MTTVTITGENSHCSGWYQDNVTTNLQASQKWISLKQIVFQRNLRWTMKEAQVIRNWWQKSIDPTEFLPLVQVII